METSNVAATAAVALLVGKRTHPFWSSAVRSQLTLTMMVPPESQLLWLKVVVASVAAPPTTYKVSAGYASGQVDTIHCNQKEALNIVKNEWLCLYANRTRVDIVEHKSIDMSSFLAASQGSGSTETSDSSR